MSLTFLFSLFGNAFLNPLPKYDISINQARTLDLVESICINYKLPKDLFQPLLIHEPQRTKRF